MTATENYLKAAFNAREWSDRPVTVGLLASVLGLSPSSASEQVRKLTDRGLFTHARYGAIELTPEGHRIALAMVRKHRIVETFLVEHLGYGWDEVHDEAEALEHAVSDLFVERLARRLGSPTHDPHGDPIPGPDGTLPDDQQQLLDTVPAGCRVRVARVWDDDPALLRHLDDLGITIGTVLTVLARAGGTVEVNRDGTPTTLDSTAARSIRVVLLPPDVVAAPARAVVRASDVIHVRLTDIAVEVTNRTRQRVRMRVTLGSATDAHAVFETRLGPDESHTEPTDAVPAVAALTPPSAVLRHWSHESAEVYEGGDRRIVRVETSLLDADDHVLVARTDEPPNGLSFSITARDLKALVAEPFRFAQAEGAAG
ncbi:hypothetical protein Ais01nite_05480 [Asanoa ishikariensis]|uniref:Manganese transport regulator n=1 Tax=Asanoa ishikariensis TaxID=137265 RepID=A0A1H3TFM5_9ACTN|nr:metal-dependent transcriptional regulator [Asanoa ishikariensis]GIF62513.1 hypothetical protein Ais01nite_05480 [Asanoa ishikariensis]SDZ49103.1 iron (metal) dependent repressor, DtxR family [Asanoa ishikariensis]